VDGTDWKWLLEGGANRGPKKGIPRGVFSSPLGKRRRFALEADYGESATLPCFPGGEAPRRIKTIQRRKEGGPCEKRCSQGTRQGAGGKAYHPRKIWLAAWGCTRKLMIVYDKLPGRETPQTDHRAAITRERGISGDPDASPGYIGDGCECWAQAKEPCKQSAAQAGTMAKRR